MSEKWNEIPSFPGYYASDIGRIRKGEKLLKQMISSEGYPRVTLQKGGKPYYRTVHPLILEAFRGPRPNGFDACHNDGSKENNCLDNLRWDTRAANIKDQEAHGTSNHCSRNGRAKLTAKQVIEIRKNHKPGMGHKLAKKYGIGKTQYYRVLNEEQWDLSREGTDTK